MSGARDGDPFAALGLAARPDLTDDDVRAAWRRIAAATHPDRADGGDPDRFAMAAAAYTVLRTRYGRGEALADLADRRGRGGRGRADRPAPDPAGTDGAGPAVPESAAGPVVPPDGPATEDMAGAPPAGHAGVAAAGLASARLLSRIRRGRVVRLALRVLIAASVSAGAAAVAGAQPATPALIVGALTWLLVTAKNDLAPPG